MSGDQSGVVDPTTLTPAQFLAGGMLIMPRGPIWYGPVLTGLVGGITDSTEAVHAYAVNLLTVESDPAKTEQLLPDFERVYGLPDPCTPLAPTIPQRRAALLAKIAAQGGQSRAYFIAVAAGYGIAITIDEIRPFRAGINAAGDPVYYETDIFRWSIVYPGPADSQFECIMQRLAPAHTALTFSYT